MAQHTENNVPQKCKNPPYLKRLLLHGKEDLALSDIVLDGIAALIMTTILLAIKVFGKSEASGLYLSAVIYLAVFFVLAFIVHILLKSPYKIIREQDEQLAKFQERLTPKFKISCSREMTGCHVPNDNGQWSIRRIQVVADCESAIKNCQGHLIKVEKDGVAVFSHDTLALPFAKQEAIDSLAKTLHPHIPEYLDVLCWFNPGNIVHFATKPPMPALDHKREYVFSDDGEYILTIGITGVGISGENVPPETIELKFDWKCPYESSTLETIPKKESLLLLTNTHI